VGLRKSTFREKIETALEEKIKTISLMEDGNLKAELIKKEFLPEMIEINLKNKLAKVEFDYNSLSKILLFTPSEYISS